MANESTSEILNKGKEGRSFLKILFFFFLLYSQLFSFAQETGKFSRIISLGPRVTESVYLLKCEDKLAGCTTYCIRPEEAKDKPKIGTIIEVNTEAVAALKPDLILATSLTQPREIEQFRKLGFRTEVLPLVKSWEDICNEFLFLGKLLSKEKEASEIVDKAKGKLKDIENKIHKTKRPSVFIQIGVKPVFAVTKDSFINDMVRFSGGNNIAENSLSGIYSREMVLASDPDFILIVTMGIAAKEEAASWNAFQTLKAVKNNHIFILDAYKMCSPTPVTFVEMVEEIGKAIHS